MLCPYCGSDNWAQSMFCSECGEPIPHGAHAHMQSTESDDIKPNGKACPECGEESNDDAKFCQACGAKFEIDEPEDSEAEQPEQSDDQDEDGPAENEEDEPEADGEPVEDDESEEEEEAAEDAEPGDDEPEDNDEPEADGEPAEDDESEPDDEPADDSESEVEAEEFEDDESEPEDGEPAEEAALDSDDEEDSDEEDVEDEYDDSDEFDDDGTELPAVKPLGIHSPDDVQAARQRGVDLGFPESGHTPDVTGPEAIQSLSGRRFYHKPLMSILIAIVAVIVALCVIAAVRRPLVSYPIDEEHFSDPGLLEAMTELDTDHDGYLTSKEIDAVEDLTISSAENVSGLGIFTNLRSLTISSSLKELDLSDVPWLRALDISGNGISSLDTSTLSGLQSLDISSTAIRDIDLSQMPDLVFLDIQGTPITTVDVSSNANLLDLKSDDTVEVTGMENTPLNVYWVVSGYTKYIPSQGTQDSNSIRATASYDSFNRLSEISYHDTDETGDIKYTYDDLGNLVNMTQKSGTTILAKWDLTYDDSNRLVSAIDEISGDSYSYTYDDNGYISGYTESYTDSSGADTSVTRGFEYSNGTLVNTTGSEAATLTTDANGKLISYKADDGSISYEFSYDDAGRCVSIKRNLTDNQSCVETLTYDSAGVLNGGTRVTASESKSSTSNRSSKTMLYPGVSSSTFTYDTLGNLMGASLTRTADGSSDVCNISYSRIITSEAYAPIGTCLVVSDPMQVCCQTNWAWTPWILTGLDNSDTTPLLVAFNPDELWIGSNNPMKNSTPYLGATTSAEESSSSSTSETSEYVPTMPGAQADIASRASEEALESAATSTHGLIQATTGQ